MNIIKLIVMDTKILLVGLIALIVGAGGGYLAGSNCKFPDRGEHMMDDGSMMHDHDHSMNNNINGAMDGMISGLSGKTGDEFDQAFLSGMIRHHEGAVEMANAALENAEHDEIKVMAEAIIEAQTNEITQMRDWQMSWYGY